MFLSSASTPGYILSMGRAYHNKADQQVWIRAVADMMHLSVSALARKAGLSPSTLNKFLNDPTHEGVLKEQTLLEISRVSGVAPMEAPGHAGGQQENEVSLFDPQAVDKTTKALIENALADGNTRQGCIALSRTLDLEGILPGDFIGIDLSSTPGYGDIVLAELIDRATSATSKILRVYQKPFLVAHTASQLHEPLVVNDIDVRIIGVAKVMVRIPNRPVSDLMSSV